MCKTRYEWTLIDFAMWFAGAVLVPVYETSSPAQVLWNLTDSGATGIIVETADHFARFDEVHPDLPLIRNVWQIDLGDLDKLAASGTDVPDEEVERRRNLANGLRPRHPHLHRGHDRAAEGMRAHPLQLRRAVPQLPAGDPRGGAARLIDAAVRHPGAHLRAVHRGALHARRRQGRATSRTPSSCCRPWPASNRPSCWPCRACSRRSTTRRSRRPKPAARADLPRGRRGGDRALEGRRRRRGPARAAGQIRAVRPAGVQQDQGGAGRPGEVRRLRLRTARTAARALLPQPGHDDPRRLRPHRDHRARSR